MNQPYIMCQPYIEKQTWKAGLKAEEKKTSEKII